MQISAIKTREDALALVDAVPVPSLVQMPTALTDATPAQAKVYEAAVAEATRVNAITSRQAALVASVKALVTERINSLPPEVKVIGLEVRADAGDIEVISIRIIKHK